MRYRRTKPHRQMSLTAVATLVAVLGFVATPAVAAISARFDCSEAARANLEVSAGDIKVRLTSHNVPVPANSDDKSTAKIETIEIASSDSLLAPRAEAAIRSAFDSKNSDLIKAVLPPMAGADSQPVPDDSENVENDAVMNTRLPGISDDDLLQYKKQMYRRDI